MNDIGSRSTSSAAVSSAPGSVAHTPVGYRVRARWGDALVAESGSAVRIEQPGRAPVLALPLADIRTEQFRPRGSARSEWGLVEEWTLDGGGAPDLRAVTEPSPQFAWLAGFGIIDHDRVVVEVVDAVEGGDERDVTVKRFPTWGDAADLLDVLDVRPDGPRRYRSVTRPGHLRDVAEGSQLLAQAIVAAGREAPGRRMVSGHMVFLRVADATTPLEIELNELSGGRTFTSMAPRVLQSGRCRAAGTLLLDVTAPDVIGHAIDPPEVPGPYDCEPFDMSVTGRDLRVVDGAYTDDPEAPVGPPVIDAWVRFRDVPHDPCLHAGLLVQFTGHLSIAAAMRPHRGVSQRQAHRSLTTAINAIAVSLHDEPRADRWMLYHHRSTFTGGGMSHSSCRVHGEDGRLLASFTVDGMIRPLQTGSSDVDHKGLL